MLLFVVAGFAGRDEIAFGASAAANQGNDVVHGQLGGFEFSLAVIADACGPFSLPPLA